jgi:vacuolar-type H+-ATPase subunit I/STV1
LRHNQLNQLKKQQQKEHCPMAMSTTSASAITRSARKLKDLAHDAITLPTTEELYARKVAELHAARRKLDGVVQRQLKLEEANPPKRAAIEAILAEKAEAKALIRRLEDETSLLRSSLDAQKPPRDLTPEQKIRLAASTGHLSVAVDAADADELRQLRQRVNELARREREHRAFGSGPTPEAWLDEHRKAKADLIVAENGRKGPYPRFTAGFQLADLEAARVRRYGK